MPNSRQRRNERRRVERRIEELREQAGVLRARIAAAEAARRVKRNHNVRESRDSNSGGRSEILQCLQGILSDSDNEFEVNCSEVIYGAPEDEEEEVQDITDSIDCRIYEAKMQGDRALRIDAQREADLLRAENSSFLTLMSTMDKQQQQSKHVMLPCVERQSDWKDDWTYSEHVIGANERLRIIHEGRALARQRVVEAQAALRRRRQEQSDIEVPKAA